jgi:hypothetical protein
MQFFLVIIILILLWTISIQYQQGDSIKSKGGIDELERIWKEAFMIKSR